MTPRIRCFAKMGVVCASLLITGCGPLVELGDQSPAPDIYALSPSAAPPGLTHQSGLRVMVEEPAAAPELVSERIALRMTGTEIKYYAAARWSDRPSRLLRDRLVEALEQIPGVDALGRDVYNIRSDVKLQIRLRDFAAHYRGQGAAPDVVVRMTAMLIDSREAKVLAKLPIDLRRRASGAGARDVIDTLDDLSHEAIGQITAWVVEQPRE